MANKKFEFLPHTADVYVQAYGKTMEEAFANTALGMEEVIVKTKNVKPETRKHIIIESEDEQSLLVDFLTQFLILHDAENLVFSKINVKKIEKVKAGLKLEAEIWGEQFDEKKHEQGTYVKAATYRDMEIEKNSKGIRIKVLLDI
jgi:SHS2 domain-containing protein